MTYPLYIEKVGVVLALDIYQVPLIYLSMFYITETKGVAYYRLHLGFCE